MGRRASRSCMFEWLCAALIVPGAALAQQSAPSAGQQSTPSGQPSAPAAQQGGQTSGGQDAASGATPGAAAAASSAAARDAPADAAAGSRAQSAGRPDDPEPAVDTSPEAARGHDAHEGSRTAGSRERASATAPGKGKAMDHLELGTTDITGNRELPKVMYIVPWKRSALDDLTGKPLNSLIDQTLQPVDRDEFRRENRYYRAVTGAGGDADRSAPGNSASAVRDER